MFVWPVKLGLRAWKGKHSIWSAVPNPDLLFNNGKACQISHQFVNMEITDDLRCQSSDEN
jgi:hypothetical protein